MRLALLASVMHTGTTFVQRFVEGCPGEARVLSLSALRKNPHTLRDSFTGREGLLPGRVHLVKAHAHLRYIEQLRAWAALVPTVVPLRDPLLSVISRKARTPGEDALDTVEQWIRLATDLDSLPRRPYYLPVDLLSHRPHGQRYIALEAVARMVLGLNEADVPSEMIAYVGEEASAWQPQNPTAQTHLHDAYDDRDRPYLASRLGPEMAALERNRPVFGPTPAHSRALAPT